MHGSETWPMKVEHELTMNRTEMSMITWMCGVKLNERKESEELGELLGLDQSVWGSKRVGWDGLDMLNEKMIMTGLNVV